MYDLVRKNNMKILVGLISVMILFLGLTFLVRKDNSSLSEYQRILKLYDQVQDGEDAIAGTDYVTFDAYFLEDLDNDGNAEGVRGNSLLAGSTKKLYLKLNVLGDVTLKDANISFTNSNVRLTANIGKSSVIKNNVNSNNVSSIALNDSIGNGTTSLVNVTVTTSLTNDLSSFSGTNKVILTGTVHNNITGEDIAIEKEVDYTVDWYAKSITSTIGSNYTTSFESVTEESTGNNVIIYNFNTYSDTYALLKGAYINGTVPQLNGYDPIDFKIEGVNVTYDYDPTTFSFTAKREAVLDGTLITSQAYSYRKNGLYYNDWKAIVTYPAEASIDNALPTLPVKAKYEGYNNQKPEYTNPLVSSMASKILVARFVPDYPKDNESTVFVTSIQLGRYSNVLEKYYINKTAALRAFAGDEIENTSYDERLYVKMLSQNKNHEVKGLFINLYDQKFNDRESITDITKYNSVSISGAERYLGASGYVKLINAETDEVIHIFTALDWNSPYTFDEPVHKIRFETSELFDTYKAWKYENRNGGSNKYINIFSIYATKEIDNEALINKYQRDEFTYSYVSGSTKTNFTVHNKVSDVTSLYTESTTQYGSADYITYKSSELTGVITGSQGNALTSIDSNKDIDVKIYLQTGDYQDIVQGWIDGEFLVALPQEILDINIDSITITNDRVTIDGYEKVEIDGRKCIKILTSNTEQAKYNIVISGTITPDARVASKSTVISLYGYNGQTGLSNRTAQDKYDVNGNLDTDEYVNYGRIELQIQAPNELITTSSYIDRNDKMTISPLIAEVNPIDDSNVGTVEIGITNSSQYNVENIVIVGKIGFTGNTYQISANNTSIDLGSEFDTHMTSDGITYPSSINGVNTMLDGKVTIYYSDQESPTRDLNDTNNNWKTKDQITDFNSVKTYMIVINDYVLDRGKQARFTYDVELPLSTSNLNKVTYFNHGVYYDAILDEGNHALTTGGSKLGIRVSRQYNLELKNTKIESTRAIDKTKYLIIAKDSNDEIIDQRILTTNANGIATTKNLYVGQKYELKQLSVKNPYILDEEVKTFEIKNGTNDVLELEQTGTYKNIVIANDQKLDIELENETTYDLVLTNTDFDTDEIIPYSKFKITGKGYESGYNVLANDKGQINLKGLYLDELYEVEQISTNRHLLTNKFYLIIRRDTDGNVKINIGKEPSISAVTNIENGFSGNGASGHDGLYNHHIYVISNDNAYVYNKGYVTIDLTGFKDEYTLDFEAHLLLRTSRNSSSYATTGYLKIYLTDNFDDITNNNLSNPLLDVIPSSTTYHDCSITLAGGKEYYLYFEQYNGNYSLYTSSVSIGRFEFTDPVNHVNGYEYVTASSNQNVATFENSEVTQTLVDSDNQDSPVLNVNVKNHPIPTYTLELTKINPETQEPLAGAQYKVTGPGLPDSGKYITTDADGKASIVLNKKYSSIYVNDVDYSQYESEYTIVEATAPIGYTLDNNPIKFTGVLSLQNGYINYSSVVGGYSYYTDLSTENNNTITYTNNSKFKEATWDNDNNTLKVTMYDYPLIKITKTDAETGELLPNTVFEISKVEKVGANTVLVPALNSKGEIIGNTITIDGVDYNVVTTDDNGKLNFDLLPGQYRLREIQAADEKYEVDTAIYYFGVGETVPHREPGVSLAGVFGPSGVTLSSYSYSSKYEPTSDGGWIILHNDDHYLAKYDANLNLLWDVPTEMLFSGTSYKVKYFDDPDRVERIVYSWFAHYPGLDLVEDDEGNIIVSSGYYGVLVKFDKDGNRLWQSTDAYYTAGRVFDRVCTYEGNTDANGHVIMYVDHWVNDPVTGDGHYEQVISTDYDTGEIKYYDLDLKDYNKHDSIYSLAKRDDDTYYCHFSNEYINGEYVYYNYADVHGAWLAKGSNGDILVFESDFNHHDGYLFELADGTLITQNFANYIKRYDKDGNFVGVYNLDQLLYEAEQWYINKYNLTVTPKVDPTNNNFYSARDYKNIYPYPNGDILVYSPSVNAVFKIRYNEAADKFDIIYYVPLGINGYMGPSVYYSINYTYDGIKVTSDGGFAYSNLGSNYTYNLSNEKDPYYNTPALQYDMHFDRGYDQGIYIHAYDGEGKIKDFVRVSSTYRDLDAVNNLGYDDLKYLYLSYAVDSFFLPAEDGSNSYYFGVVSYGLSYGSSEMRMVELADGSMIDVYPTTEFQPAYLFLKVDSENGIEWVKTYKYFMVYGSTYNNPVRVSNDGTRIVTVINPTDQPVVSLNGEDIPYIVRDATNSQFRYVYFDIIKEVQPSGPEAYTLDIENKRKEYKITASSNTGGEIKVINPADDQVILTTDGDTTTLETVKYGDDNKYTIKISTEPGYVIKSVKVNGEDASYKVNDDYSITLDTIKDIKENKNIQVTYDYGLSQVIVKHYLNGTTESIFSDEILTGQITTPYKAESKSDYLYSIAEENGELILPDNMEGVFTVNPITVIFYYKANEVDLKVNYYIDGTETELAPSYTERGVLGSSYQTSPLDISNYDLSRTIGDETGTLTRDLTEVTYMYREITESTITIRHVDKSTNQDIVNPIVKTVTRHTDYTTDDPVNIPAKYRQVGTPANATGPAEDANIEVIYYYEVIPFNIKTDKKINSVLLNGEKQTITNGKNISITPAKKDNLIVYYEIIVENTGDIKATFKVVEGEVPNFVIYDQGQFTKSGNDYILNVELEPGEKKTYKIGYKWNQKDYGISTNEVEVKDVANDKGFDEPDSADNKSTATVETKIPKEVLDTTPVIIPNTIDKIMTSIMLLITSIIGIITSLVLIRKRRIN